LALAGIGIGGIGFGLITPVTVVLLEMEKVPGIITGTTTMFGYISIVIFSRYAGELIDRFKVKKILIAGLFIWMLGAAGHIWWKHYLLLYPIKFIMGIGGTLVFVSTEVTINYLSDDSNRGRNIGLYVVLLSIGIAVGTLLIWTIQVADWLPFVIGTAIMFLVLVIQKSFFLDFEIKHTEEKIIKMQIKEMPLVSLLSAAVYGLFESSIVVALPMYGLRNNFTTNEVSLLLASFVTGGIVILYIIGVVSDRYNKFNMLLIISALLGLLFVLPALLQNFVLLMVIFFSIGGIVPAFYTVGLNYTVEKVEKKFMAQANGYYVMMYGAGTIAGPLAASILIELDRQFGYWLLSSLLCFSFFIIFVYFRRNYR
jgi:MFS family permease